MNPTTPIRVVHAGAGPVGCRVINLILQRPELTLVGVVDADPSKIGQPLEEFVSQAAKLKLKISGDTTACIKESSAAALTHTTVSYLPDCIDHLREIARTGVAAVSSTEELLFPWLRHPKWAAELDQLCQASGTRILGTGINPGFLMDLLPVVAAAPCERVRSVRANRVVNAATRRGPLQKKVGAGLTKEQFKERVAGGRFGHVGYCESAAVLGAGMGWKLDEITETIEPVIAKEPVKTDFVNVQAGQVAGIHQVVRATTGGREVIHLDLKMYVGAPDPHDAFELDSDPPIAWRCDKGVAGDPATAAILLNSIPRLLNVAPGVRTVLDLPSAATNLNRDGVKCKGFY